MPSETGGTKNSIYAHAILCYNTLIFFVWALYLWLRKNEKGRDFLKKLHLYRNDKDKKDE